MISDYRISLAPMEGIITYIFRRAYVKHYGSMDNYYTPFITSPVPSRRESNETDPLLNDYKGLIPQILTNKSDTFLAIAKQLKSLGYDTVNLNLGCPSGTVVSKHRGSGLLRYPDELLPFLDEIYEKADVGISIKTRIGFEDTTEFEGLLKIFMRFPVKELIVHPRLRTDYYKGPVRMDVFKYCYDIICDSGIPLCYNGDIQTGDDITRVLREYPKLNGVMTGRGILMRPGFVRDYVSSYNNTDSVYDGKCGHDGLITLRAFHDDILNGYIEIMSGEKPVLFKMKEIWSFLGHSFTNPACIIKSIHKTKNLMEYKLTVRQIFENALNRAAD